MKTAEIRACQPREGLCGKGCRHPGATVGRPGLVRTRGQEFGRWVRLSRGSAQLPPPNGPLPAEGAGGRVGARGSSVNTLMGLRELGRNVGPTVPGDSRREGSGGDKALQVCREEREREGQEDEEEQDGLEGRKTPATTLHPRACSVPPPAWSPGPSRKPGPALWDKRHKTGVSCPALLSTVGPGAWPGTSLSFSFLTPETGVRVFLHP